MGEFFDGYDVSKEAGWAYIIALPSIKDDGDGTRRPTLTERNVPTYLGGHVSFGLGREIT